MAYMMIDKQRIPIEDEKNILAVIRKAGINLPTFCYHSELSTYGACRMCVVETERGDIVASCSEQPRDGMVIYTNTPRLQKHRKMILELLLAAHCRDCTTCDKNGHCTLQDLASRFGIKQVRFPNSRPPHEPDRSSLCIVRDPNKCILCGDCVRMCSEIQGMGILDFAYRGSRMQVMPAFNRQLADTACVGCGQCRAVCPTGAITIRFQTQEVWDLLADPQKRVVAQLAPAVRVAIGEAFGLPRGENALGKIVAALRRLGFDEIYDTALGADLTVMEESRELADRLASGSTDDLPLFTSCCPAWFRFCAEKYPSLASHLSSCRSPQQMFAALVKEHYRQAQATDPRRTAMVSIMPCTAKKAEAARPDSRTEDQPDVDAVITTQELIAMIRAAGIEFAELEAEAPDMPFGLASGAGVLFGVTGGVTEAVLRRLTGDRSAQSLKAISFTGIRGLAGVKEATIELDGRTLRLAVVSGLRNAAGLIDRLQAGDGQYDFVEVMACPNGCVGGGGQPLTPGLTGLAGRRLRAEGVYNADLAAQIKRSEENPMILALYGGILKGRVHKLLHRP